MSDDVSLQTVLLIEDDPGLALGLTDALEFEGFSVLHESSGEPGLHRILSDRPTCVILDVMLPDTNGYQVCSRAREAGSKVPILMLTARGQEVDKIRGLDAGADDYVTKPFSVGELLARVRAAVRRNEQARAVATASFRVGEAVIDPHSQTVRHADVHADASFYEIELLKLLYERQGLPVSRDEILNRVWGAKATSTNRTVDNVVVKLRKKIEPVPDRPKHILTVYGFGYKLIV